MDGLEAIYYTTTTIVFSTATACVTRLQQNVYTPTIRLDITYVKLRKHHLVLQLPTCNYGRQAGVKCMLAAHQGKWGM